jgi:ankyrin repeat protein
MTNDNIMRRHVWGAIFSVLLSTTLSAQVPGKIDFGRDVQPLFRANCVGCHGPSQQKNSFRLDRRRDAMRGGTIAVIGPGNSAGSRLYLRLVGTEVGLQMPPTGALDPKQIDIIKAWIDQGAQWPDAASGEAPVSPPDPRATKIMEALRNNYRTAFKQSLRSYRAAVNRKGPGGATPLMYAALYGNSDSVRQLLQTGADPNLKNGAGATALMWAVNDLEKTQLLVEAGADVNARSDDGQTPLLIAAGYFGSSPVVKLLLDRGANPSVRTPGPNGDMTPLSQAAYVGDADVLQMLLDRGADAKSAGFFPLTFAAFSLCARCVDLLAKTAEPGYLNLATFFAGPPFGDPRAVKLLVDSGADIKATDPEGRTILMITASSATLPLDTIRNLIDRGADVNVKSAKGDTALDFAKRHGQTAVVDLLLRNGAREGNPLKEWSRRPAPASSVRAALERSIPLLQRTDVSFAEKSGCISCHNNTLTAMTVATARKNAFAVDEQTERRQLKTIANYIDSWSERGRQGVGIPGDSDTISYILLGMAAENYPPDGATDALARFLKGKQTADGRWLIFAHRPPLESSDFEVTAASLRALQVYAPKRERPEYEKSIQLAACWLATAKPNTTEDRVFQLLGFAWAFMDASSRVARPGGSNKTASMNTVFLSKAARELLAEQRPDGGWAQLPSLASDAYATGQALVALNQAHLLSTTDPAYKRGTQFLMNTQLEDGSWYVKSRALPIQPFFESGFPHGRDQFVSAAATNWATMALALTAR